MSYGETAGYSIADTLVSTFVSLKQAQEQPFLSSVRSCARLGPLGRLSRFRSHRILQV